jgi:fatty-acyl-CoA synthase
MNPAITQHTLGDLVRRTAKRFPDKTAIVCGNVRWTYAQFDALCNRLAHGLVSCDIVAGDRVAILSRNSHAFAALRFALARIGAVLVPINFMLNAGEVAFILRHAGAKVLALGPDMVNLGLQAATLDTAVTQLIGLPGEDGPMPAVTAPSSGDAAALSLVNGMRPFEQLMFANESAPTLTIGGQTLAQIIYTSGTESLPKGAMLSHDAVLWEYVSCVIEGEINENDRMLHALPLYHCAQLDVFLGPGVYVGATNVITGKPTAANILPMLQAHKINSFFAPPSIWIALLRSPLFDTTDLSALRKGYYGAAIMPIEVLKEIARRLPQIRLWNFYGQTEIAPLATVLKPEDQLRKAGSAGRAVLNVETRVVDDQLHDVQVGQIGEVVHRSPQLLQGYFNDPQRTSAAFSGDWFHSGDLATIDAEGYITIVDRKKDMVKSGGENVASREVEEMIYRRPEVSEVAVIGLPHPYWIEAVTAVVVLKAGTSISEQQLIAFCRDNMAPFKTPKRIVFVDSLPKNPSGKLLKRELRQRFEGLMTDANAR